MQNLHYDSPIRSKGTNEIILSLEPSSVNVRILCFLLNVQNEPLKNFHLSFIKDKSKMIFLGKEVCIK